MNIGIDLGTTFSVIAVSGRVELVDGYPPPTYLEELDVTIIPDPYGNDVIPSAVWADPADPETLIVGTEARDRADDGQSPILASKRTIGTNIGHTLSGREYSAREVATIILRYLKDVAEQALGKRVERAVITHPAFFEGSMMRETAEAARDAGFDFDQEKHLMMEPTAAALAYTGADPRDPLRLLAYDLGGGTFDVTVLERRGGVSTIKAFGGDRLLGGYTFDRRLASWLYERLRERDVQITVDDDDPRHHAVWTRLLQIAEDTKLKLANARTDKVPVHIREQLTDDNGRRITMLDSITRAQYVELIQDLLDATLEGGGTTGETKGCEVILAEAGLTIEQVDEILLVGGSTWGPWVSDAIDRKWGRTPRLLEPDRIVAAGAALHASSLPTDITGTGCSIELDVESRSPQEIMTIAGLARTEQPVPGLTLVLTDDSGTRYVTNPGDDGRFLFEDVELRPLTTTGFTLTAGEGDRLDLAEHEFTVEHIAEDVTGEPGGTPPLTVLPKPLFIEKADGMEPLADEGATLPARRQVEFQRTNDFSTIEIRLYQEHDMIGSVLIRDVPPEATRGSKVALTVEISRSNKIEGHATVHTRAGTVIREAPVDISIPRMDIPPLDELKAELAGLEAELDERIALEPDATARLAMQGEGDRLRRKVHRLLAGPVPDRQEIWLVLRAIGRVVRPPRYELTPPLAEFESLVLHVKDLLAAKGSDPNVQAHTQLVDRLEKEGRAAYARHQAKRWASIYDNLVGLLRRLADQREPGSQAELPPANVQKLIATMQVDQVRQELRAKEASLMERGDYDRLRPRGDKIRAAIDDVQTRIDQVDDDASPQVAQAQLLVVRQKMDPISNDIRLLDQDII